MQIDKIIRQRITDSPYWKRDCYAINAATLCDRAAELDSIGGLVSGVQRPTPFLCLVYKLSLIDPDREIVHEMLRQRYFKYLTAVVATYVRLSYPPRDVYQLLEPLLADYRKLRKIDRNGTESLWHVDELVDSLLTEERLFDLSLPRLPARHHLEDRGLDLRPSFLPVESDSEAASDSHSDNSSNTITSIVPAERTEEGSGSDSSTGACAL